ncbi:MAG: single-stranded DNA-binding protein [Ruminococcus sp.]|nr:single-stranded DNA-binding protein [Ruminococcus sp.]
MNSVNMVGRICNNLELKNTPNGHTVLSFRIAIPRQYVKKGEERESDFISCIAWRSTADFISKYFSKGDMIALTGKLHSRDFTDKNNVKRYITEVYIIEASFAGSKKKQESAAPTQEYNDADIPPLSDEQIMEIGNIDDYIPF